MLISDPKHINHACMHKHSYLYYYTQLFCIGKEVPSAWLRSDIFLLPVDLFHLGGRLSKNYKLVSASEVFSCIATI